MSRILLVEDDTELASLIAGYLSKRGFVVLHEGRGDAAVERIRTEQPELVVLDLMLPGASGLDVCRAVRAELSVPILMLTAMGDEIDEIVGLELGADDYLAKPVRPRLLLARIRSLLRRSQRGGRTQLSHGPIVLDPARRTVSLSGVPLSLSDGELDLLALLMARPGEIFSRDQLYQELRGVTWDGLDRSMDLRISRLRSRLGDAGGLIRSVRGRGYMLAAP